MRGAGMHRPAFTMPRGWRFRPTESELLEYFLPAIAAGTPLHGCPIVHVDLLSHSPWELPDLSPLPGESGEWYFVSSQQSSSVRNKRPLRMSANGHWKQTGLDRTVLKDGDKEGVRKSLVFYSTSSSTSQADKTDWVLHELRMQPPVLCDGKELVICKVFLRKGGLARKEENGPLRGESAVSAPTPASAKRARGECHEVEKLPQSQRVRARTSSARFYGSSSAGGERVSGEVSGEMGFSSTFCEREEAASCSNARGELMRYPLLWEPAEWDHPFLGCTEAVQESQAALEHFWDLGDESICATGGAAREERELHTGICELRDWPGSACEWPITQSLERKAATANEIPTAQHWGTGAPQDSENPDERESSVFPFLEKTWHEEASGLGCSFEGGVSAWLAQASDAQESELVLAQHHEMCSKDHEKTCKLR